MFNLNVIVGDFDLCNKFILILVWWSKKKSKKKSKKTGYSPNQSITILLSLIFFTINKKEIEDCLIVWLFDYVCVYIFDAGVNKGGKPSLSLGLFRFPLLFFMSFTASFFLLLSLFSPTNCNNDDNMVANQWTKKKNILGWWRWRWQVGRY